MHIGFPIYEKSKLFFHKTFFNKSQPCFGQNNSEKVIMDTRNR